MKNKRLQIGDQIKLLTTTIAGKKGTIRTIKEVVTLTAERGKYDFTDIFYVLDNEKFVGENDIEYCPQTNIPPIKPENIFNLIEIGKDE